MAPIRVVTSRSASLRASKRILDLNPANSGSFRRLFSSEPSACDSAFADMKEQAESLGLELPGYYFKKRDDSKTVEKAANELNSSNIHPSQSSCAHVTHDTFGAAGRLVSAVSSPCIPQSTHSHLVERLDHSAFQAANGVSVSHSHHERQTGVNYHCNHDPASSIPRQATFTASDHSGGNHSIYHSIYRSNDVHSSNFVGTTTDTTIAALRQQVHDLTSEVAKLSAVYKKKETEERQKVLPTVLLFLGCKYWTLQLSSRDLNIVRSWTVF